MIETVFVFLWINLQQRFASACHIIFMALKCYIAFKSKIHQLKFTVAFCISTSLPLVVASSNLTISSLFSLSKTIYTMGTFMSAAGISACYINRFVIFGLDLHDLRRIYNVFKYEWMNGLNCISHRYLTWGSHTKKTYHKPIFVNLFLPHFFFSFHIK